MNTTYGQYLSKSQLIDLRVSKYLGENQKPKNNPELEARVDFYKSLRDAMLTDNKQEFTKLIEGYFYSFYEALATNKSVTPGVGMPVIPTTQTFFADYNELQIDDLWMQFYNTITPGINGGSVQLLDVSDLDTAVTELGDNEPIPMSAWGKSSYTELKRRRFAFGRTMNRLWFQNNELWNINRAMRSIMVKFAKKHADLGYAALMSVGATTTAASTSLDNRVAAFDAAYVALGTRLSGNGFSFNPSQPVKILTRADHVGIVNQVLNRRQGSETNNTVVSWNMQMVPTFNTNVNADVGGKDTVYMIMPGLKNEWVQFDQLKTNQEYNFSRDGYKLEAQEYIGLSANSAQVQAIQLEP